jgi:hypothetical protein
MHNSVAVRRMLPPGRARADRSLVESQTLSVRFLATKAALPLPIGNDSCKVFVLVPFAPPRAGRFLLIETAAELSGD